MIDPQPNSAASESAAPRHLDIEVTTHDVFLAGLPVALNGLKLVQISDLHRGCGDTDVLISKAVAAVNNLSPDLIALTGDVVDEYKHDILPAVKMVSCLRARQGVYACLGNHDQRGDPILLRSALESAGIRVLHNQSVEALPGLVVAGIDDLLEGEPDIDAALAAAPDNSALVFLAHNPSTLDRLPKTRDMLMLSGHTHGGQIVLRFPTPWMVCRFHLHTPYVHGWFRRGQAKLYVNRGIGVTGSGVFARRYKCPPEISVFKLWRTES
jgi:predicted MPP superfamily phosphohydrolase